MGDLKNALQAAQYLFVHDYKEICACPPNYTRIAYEKNTGDSTWETETAPENKWVLEEKGDCYFSNQKQKPDANFCSECGRAMNNKVSWVLESVITREFSLEETRRIKEFSFKNN